jgi:hypothetical protein
MPTSQRPSRTCRAWRCACSSRSARRRAQALDAAGAARTAAPGFSGSTWVSLRMRNSTGIDAELLGHLVHGDLQRHHARRLARRAHRVAFRQVEHREPRRGHAVGAGIEQRVWSTAASGLPPGRSPDQLSWPIAVILPSASRRCGCAGSSPGRCVVLLNISGAAAPPSPAAAPRARRAPPARVGAQEQLAAEAAADERRDQADVLLGMPSVLAMSPCSRRSSGSRSRA